MALRKSIFRVSLATALTLSVILAFGWLPIRSWHLEPILHLFGMISEDESAVNTELQRFRKLAKFVIWAWEDGHIKDLPTELDDYIAVDFPDKASEFGSRPVFRYLDKGVDPWGSKFIFTSELVRGDGRSGELHLTVRSVGANRIDENGNGDDIQKKMVFPSHLPLPEGAAELVWEKKEPIPSDRSRAKEVQRNPN